jgi:hypothetical protein
VNASRRGGVISVKNAVHGCDTGMPAPFMNATISGAVAIMS